jgi:hypothetical protein
MNLLTITFLQFPCCFLSLRPTFSYHYVVLKHSVFWHQIESRIKLVRSDLYLCSRVWETKAEGAEVHVFRMFNLISS